MASGTIYGHNGIEHWPVTYSVEIRGEAAYPAVTGTVRFDTPMRSLNVERPVHLQLDDNRWALLNLPVQPDGDTYRIGPGSHLTSAPSWAPQGDA